MLGFSPNSVVGKHYSSFYRNEAETTGVDMDQLAVHGGVFASQELLRADGSVCPVDLTVTIVPWGTDPVLLATFRDVTERKDTEARLAEASKKVEESRDDMLAILDQLRIGTAITDTDGSLTFVSQVAQGLLGVSPAQVSGEPWPAILPVSQADKERLQETASQPTRERVKVPIHLRTKQGRQYWVETEVFDDPRDPRRKIFCLYDVSEIHDLRRLLDEKARFHELIGRSKAMGDVFDHIRDFAIVDITVLIQGETGTGKELAARAIHSSSARRDKPFIAVNCAGLTESLIGSQLFGHRRGAFTGAVADQQGLFEAANGGTIFLDEIGDIPQNIQTSLLRVLQEREITRIGEHKPRKVDVRVVAATNRDLSKEVSEGRFREDLLYRIQVARIHLPPLRQRREDIPLLVSEFLRDARSALGKNVTEVGQDAMEKMLSHRWPGNVRELKSVVDVAVLRCRGNVISADNLPEDILTNPSLPGIKQGEERPLPSENKVIQDPEEERQSFLDAMQRAGGNRARAARLLGISRATFYRHLERLDINPKD